MRPYMRRRRSEQPEKALLERARRRAEQKSVPFDLDASLVIIPEFCPALGIPLVVGDRRSLNSPSLDRIVPQFGYVRGNVRVISDHANRLKSDHTLTELHTLKERGPKALRRDYSKIALYVERESLLSRARKRAADSRRAGDEWDNIADFLETLLLPFDRQYS